MAPKTRPAPTTKNPNKRPPAQKAKEAKRIRDDEWVDANVAFVEVMEKIRHSYAPTRLEYFTAVALEGILSAPKPIRTEEGDLSITTNAIVIAKHVIEKLDAEQETPRR